MNCFSAFPKGCLVGLMAGFPVRYQTPIRLAKTPLILFLGLNELSGGFSPLTLVLALGTAFGSFCWWAVQALSARVRVNKRAPSGKLKPIFL